MKQLKTRNLIRYVTGIVMMTMILLSGCKKDKMYPDINYEVRFSINAMSIENKEVSSSKGPIVDLSKGLMAVDPNEVTHVRIGIDGTHESPFISETLPYSVLEGVTAPIKLTVGNHTLTSIYLLRETGIDQYEVLYSAVASGAPLSQFVTVTLPISFEIPLLDDVPVNVDVVALDSWTPDQFGFSYFNIGFTTINEIYFYGSTDGGTQSVMSIDVIKGTQVISQSTQEIEGWIKVQYPDVYSESNTTEYLTFNLTKDGVLYDRTFSVAELLSLPREVHLLNVYGSGMFGFEEILTLTSGVFSMPNPLTSGDGGEMFGFTVRNSSGVIVYQSNITQGPKTFEYRSTSMEDNLEYYDITISYQLFNSGPQIFGPVQTRSAHVNVMTLSSMASSVSLGIYSTPDSNYWWLFI
jgi:hypothetical protein